MARPLEFDELVEHFTLVDEDLKLLRNKSGPLAPFVAPAVRGGWY